MDKVATWANGPEIEAHVVQDGYELFERGVIPFLTV